VRRGEYSIKGSAIPNSNCWVAEEGDDPSKQGKKQVENESKRTGKGKCVKSR